jgi:hypothetical protein
MLVFLVKTQKRCVLFRFQSLSIDSTKIGYSIQLCKFLHYYFYKKVK